MKKMAGIFAGHFFYLVYNRLGGKDGRYTAPAPEEMGAGADKVIREGSERGRLTKNAARTPAGSGTRKWQE